MGVNNIRKWRVFRNIAAISGIIQGLTWFVLALICIGMYYGNLPQGFTKLDYVLNEKNAYTDLLSFCFYDTFLYDYNNIEHRLLKPLYFHIFAWIYAFLSACWLGLAIFECQALFRRKTSKFEAHILMLSAIVIIIICITDLIMMSLASWDYSKINIFHYDGFFTWDTTSPSSTTGSSTTASSSPTSPTASPVSESFDLDLINEVKLKVMPTTEDADYPPVGLKESFEVNIDMIFRYSIGRKIVYGILITLSARGFVIWIFNFVVGVILLLISLKVFQAPPILKYDNRSIPRPKVGLSARNKDQDSFFGATFAEDNNNYSTPPSDKKKYSVPSDDWYRRDRNRNNPLALDNRHRRNDKFS